MTAQTKTQLSAQRRLKLLTSSDSVLTVKCMIQSVGSLRAHNELSMNVSGGRCANGTISPTGYSPKLCHFCSMLIRLTAIMATKNDVI